MTDLAEFLLARIAEDERVVPTPDTERKSTSRAWYSTDFDVVFVEQDRWLAECEAKRRLVELHHAIEVYDWNQQGYCAECSDSGWAGAVDGMQPVDMPCPTLRLLALPYADHPDYREEWRP